VLFDEKYILPTKEHTIPDQSTVFETGAVCFIKTIWRVLTEVGQENDIINR